MTPAGRLQPWKGPLLALGIRNIRLGPTLPADQVDVHATAVLAIAQMV